MKQTIEIEVPDGKKAVWKDGKVIFEDIKPQLPKTWEEFCENYKLNKDEFFIGSGSEICKNFYNNNRDKDSDANVLPSKQAAEAHLAFMQLHQLRDCYRQGWKPDWSDNCYKYGVKWNIFPKKKELIVTWRNYDPLFLSFQTEEIAREFLTNFRDLIEQAGDLI